MEIAYQISIFFLILALIITLVRLLKGPHPADRVICLDLLALETGGLMAVHAVASDQPAFLDGILVLSIVAFLSTVVLGRMIEGFSEAKAAGLKNSQETKR